MRKQLSSSARRCALALMLACVTVLASASLASAVGTSTISGTVTNAQSVPLKGVQVEVLTPSHQRAGFAETEVLGKYSVKELEKGSYKVAFFPAIGSNAFSQYWNERSSFAAAELVEIKVEGETTEPISAKLGKGSKISGVVESTNHEPVPNVFVSVISTEVEAFVSAFAMTDALGKYETETGLPPGSYKVVFFPESGNFAPQYWEGKPTFSSADLLKLEKEEEKTRGAINANLEIAGKITGTVTDAATHKGLAGVFVTANNTRGGEFFGGGAETNSSGEYTIAGLEKGSFNLEFQAGAESAQFEYLNGSINGVSVSSGNTTSGVNIALTPKKPHNTGAPVASGTPSAGQTLSCSNGAWVGASTLSYAYKWLRDGTEIGGATNSTYVVQAADRGHNLSCEVTATNSNGHASATSNSLKVAAAPVVSPPPPPPTLSGARLTNKRFRVAKKDTALVARAPLGTSFRFTLSAPSKLRIAITRSAPGLRRGHSCLAPTAKLRKKHAKKCARTLSMGTLTRGLVSAGPGRVAFTGRIGHRPLSPGAYKAVLTASGAGGSSIPAALTFTVVR